MAGHYVSNVILAKARAMYGGRLTPQDLAALLGCRSVGEIAAYLKSNTSYATVLGEVNESSIHRGYLEVLLRRKVRQDYAALCRYDMAGGREMAEYLLRREVADQIVRCLRLIGAGRSEEYFYTMPLSMLRRVSIDLMKMSRATTFDELKEALSGTDYRQILDRYPPAENGTLRIREIENELYRGVAHYLLHVIDATSGELRQQMVDVSGTRMDAQNVTRIFRLKRYFNASPEEIRSNLLPWGGALSEKVRGQMVEAAAPEEVLDLFYNTPMGRRIPEEQRCHSHDLNIRASFYTARHYLRYSIYPMVTLFSYRVVSAVELENIINIIEGVRYGLPPEEIKPVLIMAEPMGGK